MRCDHARECWRELGPHRDFAFPFVGEIEKLPNDLRSAFLRVKLRRFEDRSVPFDEPVTPRHFAPFREDVISPRAIGRQEITKTGERLHQEKRP